MEQTSTTTELAPAPSPLFTDANLDNNVLNVRLGGELDLATVPLLEDALSYYDGRYQRVIYELEGLTFIDCAGLHGLLAPIDGGHLDGRITINTASRAVRRLFQLVEMEHIIHS